MSDAAPPVTQQIAEFAVSTDLKSAPQELFDTALRAFIDTIGVTIAARESESTHALFRATLDEYRLGPSTVLTTGERTSPAMAALLNGQAGHALDFDDVGHPIYGHPSIALIPTILAIAEAQAASGRELLEAYIIGYQVACAVGDALVIRKHYTKGWHSTATVGAIAATAAGCRLLGLSVEQVQNALGIAASTASGSRQNFGTMTKPLHPGLAAWGSVTASKLAANGFTADVHQLESPMGFFAMYGFGDDLTLVGKRLAERWTLLEDGLNVKKYPCCYNTHRTADATLELATKLAGRTDAIRAIRVTLEPGGFDPLIHHRPKTGLEGKFSAEYVIAAGLLDGAVDFNSFADDAVQRPAAQALIEKVSYATSDKPPFGGDSWEYAYSAVEIEVDGETFQERVDVPRGDARLPLTMPELEGKFLSCIGYSGIDWDGEAILAELKELPDTARLEGFSSLPPRQIIEP